MEDDAQLRDLYRHLLIAAGYAVTAVEDGMDALRHIDDDRPDAVVLDLALPRLGGRDVYQELRARSETRHVAIVVVTGMDPPHVDESEFDCVLRKPVEPETLVVAVDDCLRRSRARVVEGTS